MHNKREKEFTKKEIEAANTIVKSIEQRSHTILKVATAIVEEQIDFFTRGVMYLTPMTLKKIAGAYGFLLPPIQKEVPLENFLIYPTLLLENIGL